ncbi:MAG: DinB family protein [Cyclobacteriaceae bacterium]|nr:DinB family protein [Cyclobacteriaceae bacterium]
MQPSLQKLFTLIEDQRNETLKSVRHLTPEQFNFTSAPGKWSVADILSHIITAERFSILYLRKKIQGIADAKDTGLIEEIKMTLLKISQRLPGIKFKAPRFLVENTPTHKDLSTLEFEWESVRKEFKELLETIPQQHINRKIYKHVRAGYLNIQHALIFFREHIIHHTPQIKKLL